MEWNCSLLFPLLNAAALLLGGVTDWRRREIPNSVPAVLLLTGLLSGRCVSARVAALALTAGALWLSGKLSKTALPGGDCKLLCALTFSSGITVMLLVLLLSGLGAVAVGLLRHKNLKRNIPLCAYAAPAYFAVCAGLFGKPILFSGFLLLYVVVVWLTRKPAEKKTIEGGPL